METGTAVRIISTENHKFALNTNALQQILGADELKHRNVVVVSIAGSLRTGKSFLLNYFLKYLYSQVSAFVRDTLYLLQIIIIETTRDCNNWNT